MTAVGAGRSKLDLGRVFGDTFGVIRRQAVPLLGVTFLLGYLPSLASSLFSTRLLSNAAPTPAASLALLSSPFYWLLMPLGLLLTSFLLACQLQIAISDLQGESFPLPDTLRRAALKTLPIFGATFLMLLGLMLGMILLFVPGIILGVMWAVTLPATVADTSNPIRALGRSRALTRGNRWRIFSLAVLVWLVFLVIEMIVLGAVGGVTGFYRMGQNVLSVAVISLLSYAIYIVLSVGSAALYVQLRELKGGGESVAQVFA